MTESIEQMEPGGDIVGGGPVVVGVDGSLDAQRAVTVACEVARRFDRELVVFHAVGLMSYIDGEHVPSEGRRADIEGLVNGPWSAPARDGGVTWRSEVVDGTPSSVLLEGADDLGASFVVIGSRGVGSGQLLGSTSHHVVQHCRRPVIVVPPRV